MSKARNNHYVPRWYQAGFFEPGKRSYAYLDLEPKKRAIGDGRVIEERALFDAPSSRAFCERDLYSTFFGTTVNDEIERKLFGDIDTRGAHAIRAFSGDDVSKWHQHYQTFFEYLDIQKIRTPKGLDWLQGQYPRLHQNELMQEMQGLRMLHCSIWMEGVREIVSAEDADVKFIISDHPVTVYNHAFQPSQNSRAGHDEPSIALKGSQTFFPLNRDFCLVLTNLEYAQDHEANPSEKRTFAGNYRTTMTRTDAFVRSRKLTSEEVNRFNRVIKANAKRYIAGGQSKWLYPELTTTETWADLRHTFLPPKDELWQFGGELFARLENDDVYYQDAFGRTEHKRDFLEKQPPVKKLRPRDLCGCGSGRTFGDCCKRKPIDLRPTWEEKSIRERNLMLHTGICNVLGLSDDSDWIEVRRNITDEKIKDVYGIYDALWPRETNLLALLPKPDGEARALYTGTLHPAFVPRCALGLSLYFDQVLIEHPFVHPRSMKKELSPLERPQAYRSEFIKSVFLFMMFMPLVEQGRITLFPDPGSFDLHFRDQVLAMAEFRASNIKMGKSEEVELERLMKDDLKRDMMLMPRGFLERAIKETSPELNAIDLQALLAELVRHHEQDPLAVLQEGSLEGGKDGGQLQIHKMSPNFEAAMYLAQATGAIIATDSSARWRELNTAARWGSLGKPPIDQLRANMARAEWIFPIDTFELFKLNYEGAFSGYISLMRKTVRYLSTVSSKGIKPNVEG